MQAPDASRSWYRKLHWQILGAMVLGAIAGLLGGPGIVSRVGWLGDVFIQLLRMIIVPLIFTSIISGVASVGAGRDLGRLFSKTLGYYFLTSLLAILAGLTAVNLIRPGVGANIGGAQQAELPELETPSGPVELLLDIIPENFIEAAAEPNMLGVIFFCILFGMALASLPDEKREPLLKVIDSGFHVMMKLTGGVIMFLPIGVFGLIARLVGSSGLDSFRALGLYAVTLTVTLSFHMFITLPVVLIVLGRIDPRVHFRNMLDVLIMAFSTSSSAATLPLTLNAVEKKVGVSNRVSAFVLPMGATVNMDGTALYECMGAIFIAQALGVQLTLTQQIVVVLTALLASVGAAAVPSAGLVVIFIVLEAIGLRGPEVNLIVGAMLAIDRPLDMFRTAVNVFSDSCGAAIIARSEGESGVDDPLRTD